MGIARNLYLNSYMIVTWNVRGFNQEVKHREMRLFIRRNKVKLIAIYEQRVREQRVKCIINKIMPGWEWATNASNTVKERIWVVWDANKVNFEHTETSAQHIHGLLTIKQNDMHFQFTVVDGLHTIATRRPLWTILQDLNNQIDEP